MHTQIVSFILRLSILIITISTTLSIDDESLFGTCSNKLYSCGDVVRDLKYPFWGDGQDQHRPQSCGHKHFNLTCISNLFPIIQIKETQFFIHQINQATHKMTIARLDLLDNFCTVPNPKNVTLDPELFQYGGSDAKPLYIYYDCPSTEPTRFGYFRCDSGRVLRTGFFTNDSVLGSRRRCENGIEVRVTQAGLDGLYSGSVELQEALRGGFEVDYNAYNTDCSRCEGSGGICGSDFAGSEFGCLCLGARNQTGLRVCPPPRPKSKWRLKLGIGLGTSGFTFLVMALVFFIYHRRNRRLYARPPSWVSRSMASYPSSARDLEKTGGAHFGVQIFCYKELEKATNYFDSKRELGDGGYGTVYQGKLKDGRDIAVKRLYEHNYNRVEQFMNEVEILTRLRHQNLVSLYGFTSRHSRELLLVYEYIANGTVADHLHGERASSQPLTWTTRMNIAVETSSALVYLHASDIIHRDVKTNNILLDNNFGVKVADFGLSRLLPSDVTHVSTAPQGTPGYVDPDYHESYQLTDKSDVYSFGVVLVELISSKPAVDMSRHRHEINLSNMAINKIQNRALHELVDLSLGFESDCKVRSMISGVAELAFRCLQGGKDMRPSMLEVLEILMMIQTGGSDVRNGDETPDLPKESNTIPTLSPDSVTTSWISAGTTPNTSS